MPARNHAVDRRQFAVGRRSTCVRRRSFAAWCAAGATLLLLLAAVLPPTRDAVAVAVTLQPHQAVYRMTLASSTASSEVIGADGTMYYRFAGTCDGWTVENRTILHLAHEGGGDSESTWTFASWESTDGRHYRFRARYEQDGKTVEKLAGRADISERGDGTARFSEPDDRVVSLPTGTTFPTEHVRQLIAAGGAGKRQLVRVMFDGASLDNPYLVNALFGPLSARATDELAKAAGLPPGSSWWVRMAFFPYQTESMLPEFEIGAHYRDDGIADRIVQQFETFVLDVRLSQLQLVSKPDC
jgi:hypothetical protein